ncbi:MAG: PAS domain S-box protein [Actinobacteria bacterium]|nr:PAS domain S-box protein [Actinomycetota bacterium]
MSKPEFAAFEAIPDAIIVVGRDGSIVYSNVHADRLFGYEDGRLVGLTIDSLIPEQFFAKPTARPMGRGRELQALKSDGRKFPVEIAIGRPTTERRPPR